VAPGGFFIQYLDTTTAEGDYISETFALKGSPAATGLQMGLVTFTNQTAQPGQGVHGLLGIGYDTLEASSTQYPNFPDQLVAQGLIDSKAYSLYLDDLTVTAGSILFGGIDTDQFVGTLSSVPVQEVDGSFKRLNVLLSSMTLSIGGVDTPLLTASESVTLDSGFSYSSLDDATVKALYTAIGAVDDTGSPNGFAWVDCNIRCTRYDEFFTFRFGSGPDGPVIKLPLAESILGPYPPPQRLNLPFANACIATFLPGSKLPQPYYTLGDNFLRSAYVVYDLENNEIALAQSNFEATASNVVNIPKGSKSIPLLSGVQSGVTRLPPLSTCPPISSTSSSASTAPTSSGPTPTSSSASTAPTSSSPTPTSTSGWSNSSSITSTYYTTTVYTITSCPPVVTNCPVGSKTTETIAVATTFCPGASTTPAYSSSTVYTTLTYSSGGYLTTETRSLYVTLCPVTPPATSAMPTASYTKTASSPAATSHVAFTGAASPARASSGILAAAVAALLGLLAL
jgi:Eukaryotic aspartyl protease